VLWVLTYWFAKAAKSYDAAIVLWKNGYWQDAAMLGRTILEIALQAMYFRKEPEKFAAKFFAHETGEKNILFKDMTEYTDSDEIRGEIQKFFAEQNLDPASFKRQQNWWGSRSIWDLVKEIQAQDIYVDAKNIYRSQYASLSMLVHGTPFARRYYVRQQGNSGLVDWRAGAPPPRTLRICRDHTDVGTNWVARRNRRSRDNLGIRLQRGSFRSTRGRYNI
jgi:hypothetical protein